MFIKKITIIVFLFILFAIPIQVSSAQSVNETIMSRFQMSDNTQDAIQRFPAHLHNGLKEASTSLTISTGQSDDEFLVLLNMFLMVNFMKTNIILEGKGGERFADTDYTYLQQYSKLRVAGIEAIEAIKSAIISVRKDTLMKSYGGNIFGRLITRDIEDWADRFLQWL